LIFPYLILACSRNLIGAFTLGKAGDVSNTNVDSSWTIAFVKELDRYTVRIRKLSYVFGSLEQNRFYFDGTEKRYNDQLGIVVKDQIKILSVNTGKDLITELRQEIPFEILDTILFF
jgi:hypothetical protein